MKDKDSGEEKQPTTLALGMAAASVPARGYREEWPNSQGRQHPSAMGCSREQAEKLPEEAASLIKTNTSQARAGFGKLLIRKKSHESLFPFDKSNQFQQLRTLHFSCCFDSPPYWWFEPSGTIILDFLVCWS